MISEKSKKIAKTVTQAALKVFSNCIAELNKGKSLFCLIELSFSEAALHSRVRFRVVVLTFSGTFIW